ncbi:telomere repeats-binding bouquet formation protein 2 isoform X1 [Thalassophryne amazonica]|uniref:telomere repeats-binding bouquet formation protein 2 isoform X1 n=1 Tax=Thalassophryne amazonica TaxID=390379 RepID=UPI0014716B6B|nr:telomere repeats-binding bouquet formation protein 2 isoform X1 [Thalassophryne amazonica]
MTAAAAAGTVISWRRADYLFSDDASCPDTVRIYDSKDFLWNKVTVFHSSFLSACERRKSVRSVCIGHYVLPPASVQDEVRNVVGRLIWECEDDQSTAEDFCSQTEDDSSETESSRNTSGPSCKDTSENGTYSCGVLQHYPLHKTITEYASMDDLQKYSGDLCDFLPECFRCSICNAHCCGICNL